MKNRKLSAHAIGFLALAALVMRGSDGLAGGRICEDLDNTIVIVGESRYQVNSTADSCYANAYYDGSSEIALPWKTIAGHLPDSGTLRGVGVTNRFADPTGTDSANVTFLNMLSHDDTELAGAEPNCVRAATDETAGNITINSATLGTCTGGVACTFYFTAVRGVFSFTFDPAGAETYQEWWLAKIHVDDGGGGECSSATDYGCTRIMKECMGGSLDFDTSFP